jgi:signal transduction histidine kinase
MIRRASAVWRGGEARGDQVTDGDPLSVVLSSVCKLADAAAQGYLCCVLVFDRGHTSLQQAIAPGLPPAYRQFLEGHPVRRPDKGALSETPETIVVQLMTDVLQGSRLLALAHGVTYAQCWPILSLTGETLGVLAVYQRERSREAPFHPDLARQLTAIASNAIAWTRKEEAVRTSAALLERAQRLSSTGGFSWQPTTNELIWSEELYRIFELDPAEPVSLEQLLARVHPEDRPLVHAMLERARRNGGDIDCEHRLQMPNQAVKHLRVVAYEAHNRSGPVQYVGAIQDVTQRRLSETALDKLRSELAHVARATSLGALTASIAHEVNQPLAGVMTNVNTCLRVLASDPPNLDYARESAQLATRDCQRASNVITRLRALLCKQHATTELIDLNDAAREVIALLNGELQRHGAILQADLASDLPAVAGDRVQLQQVILNLLLNAAEAMSDINDRPRQLTIRTERDADDRVRLGVRDTGIGFNPQDVERLFDAFYTTKNGGMGMGLSVSRSIIECHHGRLLARPNDGPGATFSFSIPAAPKAAPRDAKRAASSPFAPAEPAVGAHR